jgi:hypothetical protein
LFCGEDFLTFVDGVVFELDLFHWCMVPSAKAHS